MKKNIFLFFFLYFASCFCADEYQEILERMEEYKKGTKLSAIENPLFFKKSRVELGVLAGMTTNDPYIDTTFTGFLLGYHFSEALGLEVNYFTAKTSETTLITEELREDFIDKGEIAAKTESLYALNLLYTPIYAKVSLFSNFILHYDMFFNIGIGQTKTNWESAITYNYGAGIRLFGLRRLALNFILRDFIHREKRQSTTITKHNLTMMLGLSMFVF